MLTTPEQDALKEETRRFLDAQCSPAKIRAFASGAGGLEEVWRKGVELGWTSLLVAEADGGGSVSERALVDLTLIASEFGRHAAPGPLIPTNLVAAAVSRFSSGEQKEALLPGILSGAVVATAVLDGAKLLQAVQRGGGYLVSGVVSPVEAASDSGLLLCAAGTEAGPVLFWIESTARGVEIEALHSLDLTRRFGLVRLGGVEVPSSAVLAAPPSSLDALNWLTDVAVVVQTAEMAGAMDRSFELAADWALNRYSFGRTLASYQAIKHRFADMKMWLEASHAIADAAARAVSDGSSDASELASAAKSYIAEYGPALMHECVQMLGGIGVTTDHDLHLYLRRVTVDLPIHGGAAEHRERLATILERKEATA